MEPLARFIDILETYRGHDQVLGLIGYNCTMLSDLYPAKSEKLQVIANQIYNCRTILRFLDDFSMFAYTYSYGLGKPVSSLSESKPFISIPAHSHLFIIQRRNR